VPLSVQTLINYMEELAPRRLAYDWDNVGLQLGGMQGTVEKVLVSLDVDQRILDEAISHKADFIITHHPLIFRPLSALRTDLPLGTLIATALAAGIRIYASHTNLDVASGGVNDALAKAIGLEDTEIIRVTGQEELEKIAVFIPADHVENVRNAMASAGAGWIGGYSHCTFQTEGTGTFMPLEGTSPYIGEQGKLERVSEVRLETIIPASYRRRVIQAMLKAHPYEEAAYDIYPLRNEGVSHGLGRVGMNPSPCTLDELCGLVKEKLNVQQLRVVGQGGRLIKKIAVCGGGGGNLIHAASFDGADVLLTGDIKYHEARDAADAGLAVIDAGHDATEQVIVPVLRDYLQRKISEGGYGTEVLASKIDTAPWHYF
jgi:dinuclear metal center YbgI/SA1388 family protein